MRRVKLHLAGCLALTLLSAVLLASCIFFKPGPSIKWVNYGFKQGLGNPSTSSARGLQSLPINGAATCLDICVQGTGSSQTIYASTTGPVVYSRDHGASWSVLETASTPEYFPYGLELSNVEQMAVGPDGALWFVTAWDIFRSQDGGITWDLVSAVPHDNPAISQIQFLDGYLWICSIHGQVMRLNLQSMVAETLCQTGHAISCIAPVEGGVVVIGTADGLYRSVDSGRSFSLLASIQQVQCLRVINGNVWCTDPHGTLYEVTSTGSIVWQSSSGANIGGIGDFAQHGDTIWWLSNNGSGTSLVRIDTSPSVVVGSTYLGPITDNWGRIFVDNDGTIYVSLQGTIAVSHDDGNTWDEHPFGVSTANQIVVKDGYAWAALEGGGVARFSPAMQSWTTTFQFGNMIRALLMDSAQEVLLSYDRNFSVTRDGGTTYSTYIYEPNADSSYFPWPTDIRRGPSGRLYLFVLFADYVNTRFKIQVYYSDTGGSTWSAPDVAYAGSQYVGHTRFCVCEDRGLAVVTTDFAVFQKSLPNGAWALVPGFTCGYDCATSVGGDPVLLGDGSSGTGLYTLGKGAPTWTLVSTVPTYCPSSRILEDSDGTLWLTTHKGLFWQQSGATWSSCTESDGLSSNFIYSVFVEGSGSQKVIWVGSLAGVSRGTF